MIKKIKKRDTPYQYPPITLQPQSLLLPPSTQHPPCHARSSQLPSFPALIQKGAGRRWKGLASPAITTVLPATPPKGGDLE
ncbi:hypothetical protein E2C01_020249 [Portunus trituberculatus]|uniref:Uncharacterized protein n=1 Tax=Portunus trituberculatus TaxID=210409 RepID=A0A5B7DZA5_PORTR|nr:hypothetical protein [Portunus trituberculatus]